MPLKYIPFEKWDMRNFKKEEILILKRYVKPDFDVVLTYCRLRLHKPVQVRYDPKKVVWSPSKILFLSKMFFGTLRHKGIISVAATGASRMLLLALPSRLHRT